MLGKPRAIILFFVAGPFLVLSLTDAYRLIPQFLGISSAATVVLSTVFLAVFLLINRGVAFVAIKYKPLLFSVALLGLWPLLTATYTSGDAGRSLGNLLHNILLLIAAFVIFTNVSRWSARQIFIAALVVTALGVFLSMTLPIVFVPLALEAGASIDYEGRAFGFFLQPNTLGLSICFTSLCLFATLEGRSDFKRLSLILISFFLVLATGSRFATILMALISLLMILRGRGEKSWTSYIAILRAIIYLPTIWLVIVLAFNAFGLDNFAEEGGWGDRVRSMLNFELFHSADGEDKGSLSERRQVQNDYLELISKSPFLGYGIGSQTYMLETGVINLAPHSSLVSFAFEYGVPFTVIFIVGFFCLISKKTKSFPQLSSLIMTRLLFFCLLLSFIVNHGAVENRFFFVLMGFGLSVIYAARIRR